MLNAAVLLMFFILFGMMIFDREKQPLIYVFISLVLFPPCVYFTLSPQISPQHLFLYVSFALMMIWNPNALKMGFLQHPLLIPILLSFASIVLSVFHNGDGVKGLYNAFRFFMENYGYLFVAFVGGLNYKKIGLEEKWFYPIMILFVLGCVETMLRSNFIFPMICRAFPFYDGFYDLSGVVSAARSYRSRIIITTIHPTALGGFLSCALIMLTCRLKQLPWSNVKKVCAWSALLVLTYLSGSRTAVVCALMGIAFYGFLKAGIRLRFFVVFVAVFLAVEIAPKAVEKFSVEGQGSSISLRQQQLLFSYAHFIKSPIYGNGVRYTSKYIMERDAYNERITDDEIGGLESVIFFKLIDYGLLGLFSYLLLFLWAFVFFFVRRQESTFAQAGMIIALCFFAFACFSGEIGGNNCFAYMLIGYCMGACRAEKQDNELSAGSEEVIKNE